MAISRTVGSLLLVGLLALGCSADTDRPLYAAGDEGTTTFYNEAPGSVFLPGCSAFGFQKLEDETWVDRGPGVICVWEGFAQPVRSGDSRSAPFQAPEDSGEWRLRYTVGRACDPAQPLGEAHCSHIDHIDTPPFRVARLCDPMECGPPLGMPNVLCSDGVSVGGPTGRCLGTPDGNGCGWEVASCPDE